MAGFRDREKQHFPLTDSNSVIQFFRYQLSQEPNLALCSVILGYVENTLTVNRPLDQDNSELSELEFPVVNQEVIEALYQQFVASVKASVDLTKFRSKYATRELVKRVSDVIWAGLTRGHYKDKAHLQSLYSLLTGNKLDCFGVAFGVVAACQVLGYNDVHLALSEDHAWVVFGQDGDQTAEVTWHGKGNEDKRGQSVDAGVQAQCWLYLAGNAVICDRYTELAAIVSAMNPSVNLTVDSVELASLQQELLWLLYDSGHLEKYPMALGNLGDLEEIVGTPGRPPPAKLFQEAIDSSRRHYADMHVYPYTYFGGYMNRKGMYKDALRCWADAATVIGRYNYTREDEEVYKEFMEIANELIPEMIKLVSATGDEFRFCFEQIPLLEDPECYGFLLRFYDGICQWEEGSNTPVLHIVWAKQFTYSLGKFSSTVRESITVLGDADDDETEQSEQNPDPPEHDKTEKTDPSEKPADPRSDPVPDLDLTETRLDISELLSSKSSSQPFPGLTMDSVLNSPTRLLFELPAVTVTLYSSKMRGLKSLLTSGGKFNTSAIRLQLTAQSQVHIKHAVHSRRPTASYEYSALKKRSRRE